MTLAENKKAYFDYEILRPFEAGIALFGYEVKSIKTGRANLKGAYVILRGGEAYLINCDITPYQPKNTPKDYDPTRPRKLLLLKKELKELIGASAQKGLTIVPLKMYTKQAKIKLAFGLCRGKKKHEKKEKLKKRDIEREIGERL